ncbi:GMC family oxidoreductase [Duganella sp. BJB488]|uniref:GMC family oxidoreductase n=1 Tax=unclassified Duganella TaxID=2636909 RepID=UPI000E34523F|nr:MULTISPECIES: GMC family oxidoreductase [unclassified Duganella]RFP23055.1 GMC family oxidoreductase [Duganella sp. BJB489]RFP24868.1 GMC family oxidoreductase [Duganella sp. BJB488]RFP34055.1 GMC family oxidoreductase [Duganella sp. BJB480]
MKRYKEVDVVLVGGGWTGGILGKEFSEAGMTVVCLERGGPHTPDDFSVPRMRDELAVGQRMSMMVNTTDNTETVRNKRSEPALPYRRLGSYLMGTGVGGASTHWNGHTWRWNDNDFKIRSNYETRYGKKYIPEDMTIQDWGVTYQELEKYYDKFEKVAGISAKAGNIKGRKIAGGNVFEAPRGNEYPMPPLVYGHAGELFAESAARMGYHPFPRPTANASVPYTNPDGVKFGECQYCGHCERFGCEANAKGGAQMTVIPAALRQNTFELRTYSWVTKVERDASGKKATGVTYTNTVTGEECFQPAKLVVLCAFGLNNVHLMMLSGIGEIYDPVSGKGLLGKNYCYQTGSAAMLFFEDRYFHPYMATAGIGAIMDDFHGNWDFDRTPFGFVGGSTVGTAMYGGRPIQWHPTPGGVPAWGSAWKQETAKWYDRSMNITATGTVMPNRGNFLDLDPTYRNRFGAPLMRMTFDYQDNERRISAHSADIINRIAASLNPTHLTKATERKSWSSVPYQSTHNTGGTIMGTHPGNSVTNKYGQVWDVDNLFIMGASLFPHNSAYNPTGPVAAIAYMAADIIKNVYVKSPGKLIHA